MSMNTLNCILGWMARYPQTGTTMQDINPLVTSLESRSASVQPTEKHIAHQKVKD